MNQKTRDFVVNTKINDNEFMQIINSFNLDNKIKKSSYQYYSKTEDINIKQEYEFSGDFKLKSKIDNEIINHCNRNILNDLKHKDNEIMQLKKQHEEK